MIQLYYNQWNIDMCHMGIRGPHQTKLFDVCHVYGLKILNLLIY